MNAMMDTVSASGKARRLAWQAKLATPCCVLGIRTTEDAVCEIVFLPLAHAEIEPANAMAERACRQLRCYFKDPGFRFDLPLQPRGTQFQRNVWRSIAAIPVGATTRYGDIARSLQSAARAVGQACGANPLPVIVPCHRVVAAGGLGGFAHHDAGFMLSVKRWLLTHESPLGLGAAR